MLHTTTAHNLLLFPNSPSLWPFFTGAALRGRLQRLGEDPVPVAGKRRTCVHYRVGGDVQVDLWYDADRRLVRQESVDEGHDTVLELMRITDEQ